MKNVFFFFLFLIVFFFSCSTDNSVLDEPQIRATPPPLTEYFSSGVYNIIVTGGVSGNRKYLSATKDGKEVVLWTEDGGSGREKWKIYPSNIHGFDSFIIEVSGGVSGNRRYLSVTPDGGKCDLYPEIEGVYSNRQRWQVLNFEILNPNNKYFQFINSGNLTAGRRLLSTTKNGEHVLTWWGDDLEGREKWKLVRIGNL